ncbi:MAG: cytochrome P450 [Gammaproteobacteria bacterium]|nr:cytochrome P450 [Gammaproteobacteria bacterium]
MPPSITVNSATPPLPPGPATHPVWQLLRYSFWPLEYLEDCACFGETFTFRLAGFGELVMLTRPEDIREVFRGDPAILHAGEGNVLLSTLVGETSVLVLDDAPHLRQRRVLLPPLKGERMRTFFDAMQSETLVIAREWARGGVVRADSAMQAITLRVILRAALGIASGPTFDALQSSMGSLLREVRHPLVLVLWNVFPPDRFKDSRLLPFYRLRRRFDAVLYRVIAEQRALPPEQRTPSLLSDLLAATHDNGDPLSDVELRDAIVTIVAAGHDTTALSLAWALELILPRADVIAPIDAELAKVCGAEMPRPEHLPELTYLDAVIRESLRVRNILPFVVRVLKAQFSVGGITYPKGVVLCPAIHLLHQRDDLYPEPKTFRPERFLERKFAAHEWNPFGGGNRACLGQAFALYEMKVVLATLFTELRMHRPPGAVSKPVRRGISVGPSDGVRLIARSRVA